jgi:hypothetical protein
MGLLDGLANVLTGGIADKAIDTFKAYFPPDMTPEQKASIAIAAQNLELQTKIQADKAIDDATKELTDRIATLEGTASDLKSLPVVGPIMLFIRGAQRPVWGFAVMWMDYNVFSSAWKLTDPVLNNAFWLINLLVLGFLFGERAVANVMPFITEMFKAKNGN